MNNKIIIYIIILCIIIFIFNIINNYSNNYSNNNLYNYSNISDWYIKNNKKINDYTDVLDNNPFVFFLLNNNDIKINKITNYINYNGINISARRKDPIHYSIYVKRLNQNYEIWRYPDFRDEYKRHSYNYMNNYINFLYKNINYNKKNIFEFTCYHGILDNKVRLWQQLVKKYGVQESSIVMPRTYLIPDDKNIFYQDYNNKIENNKFILKNAFLGGKTGIKITNSYEYIISLFDKYKNQSISLCTDNVCLGKREYNLVQPYLNNPFLIDGYKFNFRFYLVNFWKNNKLTSGIFKDFYLSYSINKFNKDSNNFSDIITSYSDNSDNDKWGIVDKITMETKRPNSHKTFKQYLNNKGLDFNIFLKNLKVNINKIIESNKNDLTNYCITNQNHFQVYALDMEMDNNLNPILYEANVYFILYKHLYGNLQASMYEDIFNYFDITKSFNIGFWQVYPLV